MPRRIRDVRGASAASKKLRVRTDAECVEVFLADQAVE